MVSSADDSRDGSSKKRKKKTGKVFPLNTFDKTSSGIKELLSNREEDEEILIKKKNNTFEYPASTMSDSGSDRNKTLNCTKRPNHGTSADGIDPNVKPDPDNPNTANTELIGYFGHLSVSADPNITIDLDYLELILKRGADINTCDQYGQTVLHEVARTWDPDVAVFLIERGSKVNQSDQYGRTPLHVAAAVDFPEMITTLLEHGADIEAKTLGEEKTPLHYAACNDACKSLRMLIKKGAAVHSRDYKGRTPLQAAAELDRSETAALLLEMGGKASDKDYSGHTALLLMVTKMPAVAMTALNQLYRSDRQNRKQYYDLHFLEPPPDDVDDVKTRTVLQSIVDYNQLDVIMHPVIRRLIEVKWDRFGRKGAYKQLLFNLLFILMWTVLALNLESPFKPRIPEDIWRLTLEVCGIILTIFQIIVELKDYFDSKSAFMKWKKWKMEDIEKDFNYCHPRWPQERHYLELQINEIKNQSPSYFSVAWNWFDWFVYISLCCITALHVTDVFVDNDILSQATQNIFAIVIIFIWIRLMKSVRAFQQLGPFIVMLGLVLKDFGIFIFLYANFYIPYACAFWMIYSNNNGTIPSMSSPDSLMYSLFRITLVDEYEFENMREQNAIMSYILLVSFLLISAILCVNVLIAQLSNTFQRVYDNATAIALMQQTKITIGIEEALFKRRRKKYWKYIREHCSPLSLYYDDDVVQEQGDDLRKMTFHIKDALLELDDFVREQHSQGHQDSLARLNRKMDALQASNKKVLEKMTTDMKTMQALLMAVLNEMGKGTGRKGGGGDGDGGSGRRRGGRDDDDDDRDHGRGGGNSGRRSRKDRDEGDDDHGRREHSGRRSRRDDDHDDDDSDHDQRGNRGRTRSPRRERRDNGDNYSDDARERQIRSGRGTSPGRGGRKDGRSPNRQSDDDDDYNDEYRRGKSGGRSGSRHSRIDYDYDSDSTWRQKGNRSKSRSSHHNRGEEKDDYRHRNDDRRQRGRGGRKNRIGEPLAQEDGESSARILSRRSTLMSGSLFHLPPLSEDARMQLIEWENKKERKLRKQREDYLQQKLWNEDANSQGQRSLRMDNYLDEEGRRQGDLAELIRMRSTPKV